MTALTLESAKNIGIVVAVALVVLMVVTAFVIQNVTAKLLSVLIIGGLVFGVWTQRESLQNCADKVRARAAAGDKSDVTCSFVGSDINIVAP
jgi:hypothetical protein